MDLHLLPGYGFVSTSLKERGRLPPVAGVVQFVPFDGQPRRSRNTGSKALAGLWGRLGLQPHSYLKLGRQVPVRSRPLAGREEILMYRKRSFAFYWLRPGRAGTIHEIHRSLALARCVSEPPQHLGLDRSVSKVKQAVSDYKKAVGDPEGLAELMVFYCEQAAGLCRDICQQDEGYFDAPVRMFEQGLKSANTLPTNDRDGMITRLDHGAESAMHLATASAITSTSSWRSIRGISADLFANSRTSFADTPRTPFKAWCSII